MRGYLPKRPKPHDVVKRMTDNPIGRWIDETIFDLGRQVRWSYLPRLMVYLAAGVSGL